MKKNIIIIAILSAVVMILLPLLTRGLGDGALAFALLAFYLGYPLFSGAAGWYSGKRAHNKWDFLIFPAIPSVVFLAGSAICYSWNPAVNIAFAVYYFVIGWIAMIASNHRSQRGN